MRCLFSLCVLAIASPALAADVVINEFQPDPPSADGDKEWVELLNTSGATVDVSGWTIEKATQPGSFSTVFTVPANTTIGVGEYLVIAGTMAAVPNGSLLVAQPNDMGNATASNSDAIRLVNAQSAVQDVVVYGGANNGSEIFADESGADVLDSRLAPDPGSGDSLGRDPDGDDHDDGTDFALWSAPTPGTSNTGGGGDTDDTDPGLVCPSPGAVVINELASNPSGADGDAEWVELVSAGGSVDVSGWEVQAALSPGNWSTAFTVPASTPLVPSDFLVLSGNSAAGMPVGTVVQTQGATFGNASSSSDAARLVDGEGCVVDLVAYGVSNDPSQVFPNEGGTDIVDADLAPRGPDGGSLGRHPNGADTNLGADDFHAYATPSPGSANPSPSANPGPGTDCVSPIGLVINEFAIDVDGADDDKEWVELGNPGSFSEDLGGFRIQGASSPGSWGDVFTVPSGTEIEGEGHLVIGGLLAEVPDDAVLVSQAKALGNASSSSDAIRLVDDGGCVVDIVAYGDANDTLPSDTDSDAPPVEDAFLDEDGVPVLAARLAPKAGSGESIARVIDLEDTNDNAVDFVVAGAPTPGEPNPDLSCRTQAGDLVINEFLANPAGPDGDAGTEFVEVYNPTDDDLDLSGWQLRQNGSGSERVVYTFRPGSEVTAGGFRVAGGPFVEVVDDVVEDLDLLSGSGGDLLLLYDCEGTRADAILYGGTNDDDLEDDDGLSRAEAAPKPGDDRCLGRRPDGTDTQVSVDDIVLLPACTPGESNGQAGASGGGGTNGPGGCGCSGEPVPNDPGVDEPGAVKEPGEGCATVPSGRFGVLVALLAVVGLRRRRG